MSQDLESSMIHHIAVVTTTRDRHELLKRLLSDLQCQADTDLTWVVVDDGSSDGTRDWLEEVAATRSLDLRIITNSTQLGKCASLNRVFERLIAPFYLIVDSDDRLHPTAISSVRSEVQRYSPNQEVGAILFAYADASGTPLGGPPDGRAIVATRAEFNAQWGKYDGCIGYFRRVADHYRYPEFEGEVYCGPTVLQLMMAPTYSICFSPTIIGTAEYRPEGLTAAGRALRVANPRNMMEYARLQAEQALSWKDAQINTIMYFAYSYLARPESKRKLTTTKLPAAIAGLALATVWRRRYLAGRGGSTQ